MNDPSPISKQRAVCRFVIVTAMFLFFLPGCESPPPAPAVDDPDLVHIVPTRNFDDATALTAEFQLLTTPHDLKTRVDLLWHYRGKFGNPQAEREANKHVLWLITNQPRALVLATPIAEIPTLPNSAAFDSARAMWMGQVEENATDSRILGNAGVFLLKDDTPRALGLLERAHQIDPQNATWMKALAEAYRNQAMSATGEWQRFHAHRAVIMYELAADQTRSDRERMMLLSRAASIARHYDEPSVVSLATRAETLADKLEPGGDSAIVKHNSQVSIALSSMRAGPFDPIPHLLRAGKAIEGQSVSLSDLDMSLAHALLERGDKDAVITYLQICAKATQSREVNHWIERINRGEKPDLSDYLH